MEKLKNSIGLVMNFAAQHWRVIAIVVIAIMIYCQGFTDGEARVKSEINALKADMATETAAANAEYAQKLKEATDKALSWQAKASQASADLAQENNKAHARAQETKKGIDDALAKDKNKADGHCIDGLGADSVRLYNKALGY